MFFVAALRVHPIKDLKDLSIFHVRRCYRHAGPNGPEEMFSYANDRGGQAPALRLKSVPFTVGRGPSHATRACERVSLAMQIV